MKLELRRVTLAAEGAKDARRAWPERHGLLIRLSDADGVFGIGEASPLPGYSSDSLLGVEQALGAVSALSAAVALEQSDVSAALAAVANLVPAALPSARFALETAALDLIGKRHRTPAWALLGAEPSAERELSALVGPATAPELAATALSVIRQGYRCLKIKVGAPARLQAELRALTALREQVGQAVRLRLDANGAWSEAELGDAWPTLAKLDIELFEEPGQLPASLRGALPLALDESLQGLDVAAAVQRLQERGARYCVLKPTALGGVTHCLALARAAAKLGVSPVLSHCFDGPFAWRAAAALALAVAPPGGAAQGLAPHPALFGWDPAPLPIRQGTLFGWTEPGLGAPAPHGFS